MPPAKRPDPPSSPGYADKLAHYERLVATNPQVQRKGATMPYTSVNGNMFSLLTRSGTLALRLPRAEREAFLTKHGTKLSEQYGTVLPEYVDVPDALLADTDALQPYFALSYEYARSLKPKPTTKPKQKAAKKQP